MPADDGQNSRERYFTRLARLLSAATPASRAVVLEQIAQNLTDLLAERRRDEV
jgi:hypothetical protein